MSDPRGPDNDERIFRAAVTSWPSQVSGPYARREPDRHVAELGRGWLELSILASIAAIGVPVCSALALGAALLARRATNRRWLAAALAAVWCGFLGLLVRTALGGGFVP